jgi:predicted NAD/FAD-binding protein
VLMEKKKPPPNSHENSKLYVDSIINKLPAVNLHLNTKIQAITPRDDQVVLVEENGTIHEYDHVIIAYVLFLPSST